MNKLTIKVCLLPLHNLFLLNTTKLISAWFTSLRGAYQFTSRCEILSSGLKKAHLSVNHFIPQIHIWIHTVSNCIISVNFKFWAWNAWLWETPAFIQIGQKTVHKAPERPYKSMRCGSSIYGCLNDQAYICLIHFYKRCVSQ